MMRRGRCDSIEILVDWRPRWCPAVAAFFTREEFRSAATGPNDQAWHVRLAIAAERAWWTVRSRSRTSRSRC